MPNDTHRLFVHLNQPPEVESSSGSIVIRSGSLHGPATVFVNPAIVRRLSAQLMIAADELERQVAL